MAAGLHDGHRERMRERFLKEGMENMQQHEVLEILLYYVIRQKNTNELAHRLINTFGSLAGVFDAPYDALLRVSGVGKETATLLNMMIPIMQAYYESRKSKKMVLIKPEEYGNFIKEKYIGATVEKMSVLCMDSSYTVLGFEWIATGDSSQIGFSAKSIIEAIMRYPCKRVILAHNHPSDFLIPTKEDADLTDKMQRYLSPLGISVHDHVIIGDSDFISMRCSQLFTGLFR